jgi:hypothetical protein
MKIEEVCTLIEDCFEMKHGSVSKDAVSGDIPDWDSLGHFALLEFIESKYPGTMETYPLLAQGSSVNELFEMGLKSIENKN